MDISNNAVAKKSIVSTGNRDLPVLYDVDFVIVGGSFAGVSAAIKLAQSGKRVAIIESRTYLGREVTATLRPWLDASAHIPTKVIERVSERGVQKGSEIALYMDHVKTSLEDLLLKENVMLLYASYPTEIHTAADEKKLLVIGNKSGRQVVKADVVMDATESSSVLRLSGEKFETENKHTYSFKKTIEMYRTAGVTDCTIKVPEHLGIDENVISVHQGYLENGHVFLEFQMTMRGTNTHLINQQMKFEVESRHVMINLAEYMKNHHPAFKNAYLAASSYELTALEFPRLSVNEAYKEVPEKLQDYATSDPRLWCLNESARLDDAVTLFSNPVTSSQLGETAAELLVDNWDNIKHLAGIVKGKEPDRSTTAYVVAELDQPQAGKVYNREVITGKSIPVFKHTDVLVVGGGTSGATAAITSANEGMETTLLEMNPGLGGTATLGAVDSYWFGRRLGYSERISEKVKNVQKRLHHHSPKWNIEAKMYALLMEAEQAGVHTYFNTTTIGTIMEDNRVCGVVVASKFGTFAVLAETVIDATGDGDIAAFAGADYVYGSERDHIVMWYSLAQFAKPGRSQNNFTSMVDVSNIEDYTRAIMDGRRRKRKRDVHDHGIYVASRETRHILGDEIMTLTDQLRYRQWKSVINIHFSNHDMKGKNGADWMHLGLIPPNLEIEIPYEMLLPKGLEGILIAGKAISATHDGFAAIRMQSDLENLGGVAALASAESVRNQQLPRNIDVMKLQQKIIKKGLLPEDVLDRKIENREYKDEELETLVDSLSGEQPLYMYADMEMDEVYTERIPIVEICTVGPRIIPYLEKALDQELEKEDKKRQIVLAQALAMYESSYGVPVLIREIEKALSGAALPIRDNAIRHTQLPPDQGAMPDVVYLIYTLGMTRDRRSIPIWEKIADMIDPNEDNLKDMLKGTFYYVDAVCYGIERLADMDCTPILESLYSHDNLSSQIRVEGVEPDYFKERQAMLELSIARALARCGSEHGYRILVDYLADARSLLSEHAHKELIRITNEDFKKNQEDWISYLEDLNVNLKPKPVTMKLDI
ncbi:FAD-dependent oxidoreductase [Virgibacillus siamensis]|uniref:FAD-dependent oxidoreductase n=1 Tax=Virgibacillus siamensis TaxID=480071 RepID=UPI0015895DBF|nr:FAD-dependent oxidoreductase [Virgibacillus siamensis]